MFLGGHACELCPWEVSPGPDPGETFSGLERRRRVLGVRKKKEPISVDGQLAEMGTTNLWIPGDGCVYVAPSLVAHYIRAHRYAPPQEFVDAVLRCPDMHTEEYRKASRELADDDFVEWLKGCPDFTLRGVSSSAPRERCEGTGGVDAVVAEEAVVPPPVLVRCRPAS